MGQKINPISLRLQKTNRFQESSWFSAQNYHDLFLQDLTIRDYINSVLKQIRYPEARLFFKYTHKKISIYSFLNNPKQNRKNRANLLGPRRPYVVKSRYNKQTLLVNRGNLLQSKDSKITFLSKTSLQPSKIMPNNKHSFNYPIIDHSNQGFHLRHKLSVLKKSSSYLKNLYNLNRPRVPSLFYMLHGFSSKEPQSLTHSKNLYKKEISTLEKQFYIRYFLAGLFCAYSQNKGKNNCDEIQNSNNLKSNLLNRFWMFWLLEKAPGMFLSKKYCEKPVFLALQDVNREPYKNTKRRYKLVTKAFGKFLTRQSSSDENHQIPPVLISQPQQPIKLHFNKPTSFLTSKKRISDDTNILKETQLTRLTQLIKPKQLSTFIIRDTPFRCHLESTILKQYKSPVEFFPFQMFSDFQSAVFLANEIVFYLEKRIAFRRIKTKFLRDIQQKKSIKGVRITCSGRMGGKSKKAQRSKTECVKYGQTSLHVFSSKIDFAYKKALTPFGLVGVKVWISYN